MHCPYCGKEISETAKVCPYCGKEQRKKKEAPISVESKQTTSTTPVSSKEVISAISPIVKQKTKDSGFRRVPRWALLVVGLALILTLVLIFGLPRASQDVASSSGSNSVRIDGKWIGEIRGGDGDFSATLEVTIEGECFPGEICGTYGIVGASCHGNLELLDIDEDWVFEFIERETTGGEGCVTGGHQYLQASGSKRLSYGFILNPSRTDAFETTGILERK